MYILALLFEFYLIYSGVNLIKKAIQKRFYKPKINRIQSEKPIPKQTETNIEKALKQQEKAMQQAEKNRQKQEQAEADKQFLESQLNRYNDMLSKADTELSDIERQIKIDYAQRLYAKAATKEKRKEQIIKHIISLENKVHTAETKLAKVNYILRAGEKPALFLRL